MLEIFK